MDGTERRRVELLSQSLGRVIQVTRSNTSWSCSLAFVALMLGLSYLSNRWAVLVYALSYWHYYLYALAYRYGAVAPRDFRRDAMTMKAISLLVLGAVYLAAPLSMASLMVVAAGFLLNATAARVLGVDRTYYGYELACVPRCHITDFPFSWISHPMLVGNMVAYGGTLINGEFRRDWWPLACVHVAMNLGLLLMELYVTPQRRRAGGAQTERAEDQQATRTRCAVITTVTAIAATAFWMRRDGTTTLLAAGVGASAGLYAYILYVCYTRVDSAHSQQGGSHD